MSKKYCKENVNKHNFFLCIIMLWHYWVFHALNFPEFLNFRHSFWNISSEKRVNCRIYEIIYPNLTKNYIIYHWNKNIWNNFDALSLIRRKRYFTQWFSVCSVGKIRFRKRRKCFQSRIFREKCHIAIINHFAKLNNYLPNVKTVENFYIIYMC